MRHAPLIASQSYKAQYPNWAHITTLQLAYLASSRQGSLAEPARRTKRHSSVCVCVLWRGLGVRLAGYVLKHHYQLRCRWPQPWVVLECPVWTHTHTHTHIHTHTHTVCIAGKVSLRSATMVSYAGLRHIPDKSLV